MIGLKSGTVSIANFNYDWAIEFNYERDILINLIGKYIIDIQHIGSTSIIGCCAKPIIDIAIGIKKLEKCNSIIEIMQKNNYEYKGDAGIPGRHFFAKGNSDNRTHYIHVEEIDGILWNNHVLFRDYLNEHKEYIKEYTVLKKKLEELFFNDREKYAKGKNRFIEEIIEKAKNEKNLSNIRPTKGSS